jgi:DNA-binding transcriptional LysR family regulator
LELRHLRYFLIAAQEENFHRAAKLLFVTPSSLSRRIHDLEVELGVALFERHQRRVHLTPAGRAYLHEVVRLIDMLDAANLRAKRVADGEIGALNLAVNDTVMRHDVVTHALSRFNARYPNIELRLEPLTGPSLSEALVKRRADAAFLYTRPHDDPSFDFIRVATDKLVVAMPRSHRLAKKAKIRLAEFKDDAFLWIPRASVPRVYDSLLAACHAGGLTPHITQTLMSESARVQLVSAGMGITFVFSSFASHVHEKVVLRPVEDLSLTMTLELAWLHGNKSAPLHHFIQTIEAEVKKRRNLPSLK